MSKYPIDWPECKSHIRTRWAPASVIKLATSFAAIDSRPCVCDPGHLEANINKIASEASAFKMQDQAISATINRNLETINDFSAPPLV